MYFMEKVRKFMKEWKSFSFRYGRNDGHMAWYRLDDEKGLNIGIDLYDGKERSLRCEPEQIWAERLASLLETHQAEKWDGFYDIENCICAGDSWVFHAYAKDGQEIHAMGHSQYPEGFWEMKAALDELFLALMAEYEAVEQG